MRFPSTDSSLFAPRSDSPAGSTYRPDHKGKGRAQDGDLLELDMVTAEAGMANGGGYQQMQLVEQQVILYSSCLVHSFSYIAYLGRLYPNALNSDRVYRIHYCRTGPNLQSAGDHGS